MLFYNGWSFERRMTKISLIQSVLWRTTAHSWPWQDCRCTCRLPRHAQEEGTRGLPLEPYLWRHHSSAKSSPRQRCSRAVSRWRALPVLPMALLLPTRRPLLASPVAADIIINIFAFDQVCLVSATKALLSNTSTPAGCRQAGRAQAGTGSCTQHNVNIIGG